MRPTILQHGRAMLVEKSVDRANCLQATMKAREEAQTGYFQPVGAQDVVRRLAADKRRRKERRSVWLTRRSDRENTLDKKLVVQLKKSRKGESTVISRDFASVC